MTKEEYLSKIQSYRAEYNRKVRTAMIDYANANDPYKIGDVIENGCAKGRIVRKQVSLCLSTSIPEILYFCKDEKCVDDASEIRIYQHSITKCNGISQTQSG